MRVKCLIVQGVGRQYTEHSDLLANHHPRGHEDHVEVKAVLELLAPHPAHDLVGDHWDPPLLRVLDLEVRPATPA